MPVLALGSTPDAPSVGRDGGRAGAGSTYVAASVGSALPRRNMAVAEAEVPDSRYWTAYDYYMVEREARAMRAAQINALFGKGWHALSRLIFGSGPLSTRGRGRQRVGRH